MKPIILNNLEFAQKHASISGTLGVGDCPRILGQIVQSNQTDAGIHYDLLGETNRFDSPSLRLTLEAKLNVICQRCLAPMPVHLALTLDYKISEFTPEIDEETDEVDWLEIDNAMNLNALIEDELLLALPIAPMHASSCTQAPMQSGEASHPFAVLKQLKK